MTLNLSAIFGFEIETPVAVAVAADHPINTAPDDHQAVAPLDVWPIVEGDEHFNIWVDEDWEQWPEFIPGHHRDIRQASRLTGMFRQADEAW